MTLTSRFFLWIIRRMGSGWINLLLVGGIYVTVAGSVEIAHWVYDSQPIQTALFLGMVFGGLLGATRWPGWLALLYSLLLAPAYACQAIGQVVPSLPIVFSQPFLGLVNLMNLRAFAFTARLDGWVSLYQGGGSIQDTGLFVILFCLLAWLAGAWLGWCVRRWQAALPGLLPVALLMAVNVNLSGQDVTFLAFFMAIGLMLLARTAYTRQHSEWNRRQLDYPEDLGWTWAAPAFVMVLVIVLAARVVPVFGTAEGWKAISDLFKPVQQQVEDTTVRIFGQVNPPKTSPEPLVAADTPQLGVVGAPPAQGSDLVFWVKTSDSPPPPPEAGLPAASAPQHYWRSEIFATYTGRGWEPAPLQPGPFTRPDLTPTYDAASWAASLPAPPGRYLLQQTFEILARHDAPLFSTSEPVQVQAKALPGESGPPLELRATQADGSTLVHVTQSALSGRGGPVNGYTVTSFATRVTTEQLASAGTAYPPAITGAYLQLPPTLPARVRNLASRLAQDAANPYDMAMRIQAYLRITYAYTLSVPPPPPNRDVTDYFLFEAPGGFCSYYATAMAVLLRTQGVPARVATGFAAGDYDYRQAAYGVTVGMAHAWVEVYFPGFGWIEFEPTPSQSPFAYTGSAVTLPGAAPTRPEAKPFSLPPGLTLALLVLGLAAGLGLLALLLRFLGRAPGPDARADPARQAQVLYFSMRRALGWAGVAAPSSATPAEFLALAAPRLEARQGLSGALAQATDLYQRAAYSPRPPAPQSVASARRLWARSFWEWLRLAVTNKKKL